MTDDPAEIRTRHLPYTSLDGLYIDYQLDAPIIIYS